MSKNNNKSFVNFLVALGAVILAVTILLLSREVVPKKVKISKVIPFEHSK